jgi:hypothetical protein
VPTYTVHEPQPAADTLDERATRLIFVKEGFAWLAFLAPFLWLLFNRLWREILVYILVTTGIFVLVRYAGGNNAAAGWIMLLINFAFGLEARNIYRAALARKGYAVVGVVTGRDLEDSERRFLSEWLPSANAAPPESTVAEPTPMIGARMATG